MLSRNARLIVSAFVFSLMVLLVAAPLPAAAQDATPGPTSEAPREPVCLEFQDSPDDVRIGYYMGQGTALLSTNEFYRAVFSFTCVIEEIDDTYIPAYVSRAAVFSLQQEYIQALADHERILELDSRSLAGYNNRGIIYMALGDYDEALADFNRVLDLDPQSRIGLYNRAIVQAVRGEYTAAIADLERIIEISGIDQAYNALIDPEIEDPEEYDFNAVQSYALLGVIYSAYALDNYQRYLTFYRGSGDYRIGSAARSLEARFAFELRLDDTSWLLRADFDTED